MRKNFLKVTMLALALPALLSGCATIFGHSAYPVSVYSNPSGATVSITDKKGKEVYRGESPATVMLKSGAGYFSKAEYQVKISSADKSAHFFMQCDSSINPIFSINLKIKRCPIQFPASILCNPLNFIDYLFNCS